MSSTGKPIVVGVDNSDAGRAALDWALHEGQRRGSRVVVAHAWQPDVFATPAVVGAVPNWNEADKLNDDVQQMSQRWLDRTVERARAHSGLDVTGALGTGSVAGHLLRLADDASMVVVGSRGRSGLKGLFLGSTSQQVATHSTCPAVVLRSSGDESDLDGPVVVGVDGSEASDLAMRLAFEEASLRKVQLVLLHAWTTPLTGTVAGSNTSFEMIRDSELDEGWRTLTSSLAVLKEGNVGVEVDERLEQGSPTVALADASKGASLVVVGSRGRGGFTGLMLGSVSSGVLHHAHAPVMVVRANQAPE
jgi:nucleotide-binding universal stress UspA family protein